MAAMTARHRIPLYGEEGMRRFVDARTGRLAEPEPDPVRIALQRRRERWAARYLLAVAVVEIASSTAVLALSKQYLAEIRLAWIAGIVLAFGVVGLAVWMIVHEPKDAA
jgi:hypothetical protein